MEWAAGLEAVGEPIDKEELQALLARADYDAKVAQMSPQVAVRCLRQHFVDVMLEISEVDDPERQNAQMSALEEMLTERGVSVEETRDQADGRP